MSKFPLPNDVDRCLAHGLPIHGGSCLRADRCARHVTIRHDAFDGKAFVVPRKCATASMEAWLPLADEAPVESEGGQE